MASPMPIPTRPRRTAAARPTGETPAMRSWMRASTSATPAAAPTAAVSRATPRTSGRSSSTTTLSLFSRRAFMVPRTRMRRRRVRRAGPASMRIRRIRIFKPGMRGIDTRVRQSPAKMAKRESIVLAEGVFWLDDLARAMSFYLTATRGSITS
ncbi:hypothetical protein VTK56DRAFT_9248 [Thermocarpiscus australiensis]